MFKVILMNTNYTTVGCFFIFRSSKKIVLYKILNDELSLNVLQVALFKKVDNFAMDYY